LRAAFLALRLRTGLRAAVARFFAVFLAAPLGLLALFAAAAAGLASAAAVPVAVAAFAGFGAAEGFEALGAAAGFSAVAGFVAAARGNSWTANALPCGSFNIAIQLPPGTSIGPLTSRPPADLAAATARLESATCT
jgi:hypothetical protein